MLKIGRIDYANCTPLFLQLEAQLSPASTEIVHGVPATLNQRLSMGEIDICISSSIEFLRHADEYAILPGHCIGSDGPVKSVLLFTTRPVHELSGQQLLVTSESATSVVLLQILLQHHWGVSDCPAVTTALPIHEALREAPGVLLIGDRALRAAIDLEDGYCYDLGQEWKLLTGLPFVYALWLINRRSATGKDAALKQFYSLLCQARDRVMPDAAQLAVRAPEVAWFGLESLTDYWREAITYHLDAVHLAGLKQFYQRAVQLQLLDSVAEPVFYPL